MKITNNFNIPEPLYQHALKDGYSKGRSDYSVTEIISAPRVQILRRKHWNEMTEDVADTLWRMLGTALHSVAERSQVENHTSEERLFVDVDGITLSGAIDLQREEDGAIEITDYKFTSVYSLKSIKPEWEQQQNIYAWLVEKVKGQKVSGIRICAILRDWTRREADNSATYPQAPIQVVDIPLWGAEKTEQYVKERVELHRQAKVSADWGDDLPLCSDEDRWVRPTVFAVKKEGGKRAIKLFEIKSDAEALAKDTPKGYVEERVGESVRCTQNYCGVNQWCSQYQSALQQGESHDNAE
jgi:hypothetical protein